MTFRVEMTPVAEGEIEEAYCWYRDRNPEFADRWFRELMNAISTLQENPRTKATCRQFSQDFCSVAPIFLFSVHFA